MPMQASSEDSPPRASGSASIPTNPSQGSTGRCNPHRHEFLQSDGTRIGIVPLQPPSTEPTSQETDTPSEGGGHTMPNVGPGLDTNNTEALRAVVKEALRQMGVSDVNITKTRKRPSRASKNKAIKVQQASMSREADTAWKVT